jgi:hypothetical protein
MPQNRLDKAIKTLTLNAEIKAINTGIKVCEKTNKRKLWSDTPTSGYVTDPCESMLRTEWKLSNHWIPHRVSQHRWLVIHHMEKEFDALDSWSDDESDSSDDEDTENVSPGNECQKKNKFGPIPRFSRVHEVTVCEVTNVFHCTTCCHQERMGMPCRHIASVCRSNESILGNDCKGFPLTSIRIFWWNQYYLYGLSIKKDHQKSKEAMIALAANDTSGLPCPGRLDCPPSFSCPEHVFNSFERPATDRLLNYTSYDAMGALQLMHDRNNALRLRETVPAGLSQISHIPDEDIYTTGGDDWDHPMEEFSDMDDDYRDSRKVLSRHYNELSEAFNNSKEKESLETEFKILMNQFIVRARGTAAVSSSAVGQRVSMLPASSRKRQTHGTNY